MRILTGDQEDVDGICDLPGDSYIIVIGNKAKCKVTIRTVKNEDLILECSDNLGEVQEIILENKSTDLEIQLQPSLRVYDFQEQLLPTTAAEKAVLFSTGK